MTALIWSDHRVEQLKKLFGQINLDEKNMAVLKKAN